MLYPCLHHFPMYALESCIAYQAIRRDVMRVSEQEDSINLQSNNAKALFDEVKNLVVCI